MQATLRGKRWRIQWRRLTKHRGLCSPPTARRKTITLDPRIRQSHLDLAEIAIHEMLHACFWDLDDTVVTETARDIAVVLVKQMGFRCTEALTHERHG